MIKKLIEDKLFSFGFLPLLLVMEILQDKEKYELCSIIMEVLQEHSTKYNFYIPTKFNAESIELMKYNFMKYHNLSGDIAYNNNAFYAAEIIYEMEKEVRRGLQSKNIEERKEARNIIRNNTSEYTEFDQALSKCLNTQKKKIK